MTRDLFIITLQIFALWIINQVGYFIVSVTNLPIPGNVIAMLVLVLLLTTGIIPLASVERAANLLLKHLAFFFIPIAVGLIKYGELFLEQGVALAVGLSLSAIIGIMVTGIVSQSLSKRKGEDKREYHHNYN